LFIPVWKQLRGQSLRRKIYAPLAGMRIVRIPAQQTSACLIWDAPVPSRCSVALENYDARGDFLRHLMSLWQTSFNPVKFTLRIMHTI
jgi:hypothetical protein